MSSSESPKSENSSAKSSSLQTFSSFESAESLLGLLRGSLLVSSLSSILPLLFGLSLPRDLDLSSLLPPRTRLSPLLFLPRPRPRLGLSSLLPHFRSKSSSASLFLLSSSLNIKYKLDLNHSITSVTTCRLSNSVYCQDSSHLSSDLYHRLAGVCF